MTTDATPREVGSHAGLGPLPAETLACWRINYGLDKTPHELHAFWSDHAPSGAVMALKAACAEIDRLRAELVREHEDHKQTPADVAALVAAERERCAKLCEQADKSAHPADLADLIRRA